eukprot:c8707_g2_i2.p1 GENE.c8707_g2_i2~~c8707_g2_i2.p1  ORF type:complete len:145 (+),score=64.35 c8707_g2_i2:659-1093(+)
MDDVFGEDDFDEAQRTTQKIQREMKKAGFIEGIEGFNEMVLQNGFNEGFAEGLSNASSYGYYEGVLRACQGLLEAEGPNQQSTLTSSQFDELVKQIVSLQTEYTATQKDDKNKLPENLRDIHSKTQAIVNQFFKKEVDLPLPTQ